ncbi:MAG TPA: helix-turn-helix transcriptional regulator [Oscillospiraceae bacterium]|nr:helix-turn-helix transcriptional regulator [Oscillospiraceae bacterium]
MASVFSATLALLRQERGVSQRETAGALGISQALLSHYENGIREPGLAFVVRACDYYKVSADFLLGRTLSRDGGMITAEELSDAAADRNHALQGSVMATMQRKLLVNAVSVLFDLLGRMNDRAAVTAASDYLGTAVYKLFRHLHRADPANPEEFFAVSSAAFLTGAPEGDIALAEARYAAALRSFAEKGGSLPSLRAEELHGRYPGGYQSLMQIIHAAGERIGRLLSFQQ